MAVAQTLVLGGEPIPDSEVPVTLDFYSRESRLGHGEMLMKEGTITLATRPKIYRITPETDQTLQPVQPPSVPLFKHYLVVLPFTLHPAPGERKYQSVFFKVALDDKNVTAPSLMPKDVFTKEDVKKTYASGGTFKFLGVEGKLELDKEVTFNSLRPVITAFGEGESSFYWRFAGQSGEGVNDGSKRVAAILEVPRGIGAISAAVTYQINVQRKWLDDWKDFEVSPDPYFIQFNLGSD